MKARQAGLPSGDHLVVPRTSRRFVRTDVTRVTRAALVVWLAASAEPSAAQGRPDFLAANVDSSVSPGDDFYQHANGAWLRRNPIPEGAARWGRGDVVGDEVSARLRRISERAAASKAPRGSLEQLVGDFWSTAMDSLTANRQGLAPLQPDLERIDRIRSTRDLLDVVAHLHRRDQSIFNAWARPVFFGHVEQDEQQSDRWVYSLRQSGTTLPSPAIYTATDPRGVRLQQALRTSMYRTFRRLERDSVRATRGADAVFALEARLARGFDPGYVYQKTAVADLGRLAPVIDWPRYLERLGARGVDSVVMRSPRFYGTLDSALRTTPLGTWQDYLRFWLVKVNSGSLDDTTRRVFFEYDAASTGALRPRPRWQRVLGQMRSVWLGQPLARLYEREHSSAGVKARQRAVADSMRVAFRQRIERADWLSDSTKRGALRKLERLRVTIGLPDAPEKLIDYGTMPLRRDSYALNVIRASTWFQERNLGMLGRPVDKAASDLRPSFSEASYFVGSNEVKVGGSALLIAPDVRDEEVDDAVLYGATFLGHEISHALDSDGRRYDADGNRVDWWTPADTAAFATRARGLVEQYDAFTPLEGLRVNGERSLPENMADLVGLRIALDAFKRTEQFRRGETIGGYTPLQRFFLAYAFGRAEDQGRESLATMLRNGGYAPMRERVNGVVANIPEFYEAFGVKPGDRMYRPEHARVQIW
jgi:putative endopeptidase